MGKGLLAPAGSLHGEAGSHLQHVPEGFGEPGDGVARVLCHHHPKTPHRGKAAGSGELLVLAGGGWREGWWKSACPVRCVMKPLKGFSCLCSTRRLYIRRCFPSGRYKALSALPGKNCSLSSSLCPAGSLDDLKTLLRVISVHVL